ncbi:GGDEF domain-containing protein [Rheinheimera tangshanensis]|nr:diguanylate cyclase [Rheinheimera tangshanensis]
MLSLLSLLQIYLAQTERFFSWGLILVAEQQNDVKQQLANAVKARKQLEDTYESQFKILSQFVSRLSLACKGIDIDLDNKLARLRQEFAKGTDLEKILPLVESAVEALKALESRQLSDLKKAQNTLTDAGKLLQKQRGLPDQLRRDLRDLLTKVEEPSATVQAFLPHLTHLTELYQAALATKQQNEQSDTADDDKYQAICKQISIELTNLLSELAFEGKYGQDIEKIRLTLLSDVSIEALLQSCLRTIEIIIASVTDERQSAQHFLLKLNEALTGVQQAVVSSLNTSNNIKEKMLLLNQQIEQQISNLTADTKSATSLEQLQSLVGTKLGAITCSLREKEQLEKDERELMLTTLRHMESRLAELDQEAAQFKKRLAEQKFRSLQDALTELPNRAAFDERFELEIRRSQRYGKPLSIALADVDHFKQINDNYGHSAGDKTLKVIAQALKQSLRETDFIARYGGEEFIILFPETHLSELKLPLNNLKDRIKKIPFKFKDKNVPISISFGATELKSTDNNRAAFDRADEALYEAKRAGRDLVVLKS